MASETLQPYFLVACHIFIDCKPHLSYLRSKMGDIWLDIAHQRQKSLSPCLPFEAAKCLDSVDLHYEDQNVVIVF